MEESMHNAGEELKRVDHQLYVSLKYTRTVDVIRNALFRMIAFFEYSIDALVQQLKDKKKIKEIPSAPKAKAELLLAKIDDPLLKEKIDFYFLLRKIMKADYDRISEYRRHVTMVSHTEGKDIKIDIDKLMEFNRICIDFFNYVDERIYGRKL